MERKEIGSSIYDSERDLINSRVPIIYTEQMTMKMSERERQSLTSFLHNDFISELSNAGFNVVGSKFRGKTSDSIERKLETRKRSGNYKPFCDLCGLRYLFKTNEEIDRIIVWLKNTYQPPENYNFGDSWIRDFRDEKVKREAGGAVTQKDYKAVHIRLPFQLDDKVDLLEIQLVTAEQELINEKTRNDFENSRINELVKLRRVQLLL